MDDPHFQTDWVFDDAQEPRYLPAVLYTLDRQQPHAVLGYRDKEKWDRILADNPAFGLGLQREGVTCAACHYRDGL